MSYTIYYSPELRKRYPVAAKIKRRKRLLTLIAFFIVLLAAFHFRSILLRFILPGDPDITADALNELASDMQEKSVKDAVSAFCREIIDHAAP